MTQLNIDQVLLVMNRHQVDYLLIGGMNYLLRHKAILTYDIDLWIEDMEPNRRRCEQALAELDAEWGPTDRAWAKVEKLPDAWLDAQTIFCLNSPYGAIDIMRAVEGMTDWRMSWHAGVPSTTSAGVPYRGLSDADMLKCQLALAESQRKADRVRHLTELLKGQTP